MSRSTPILLLKTKSSPHDGYQDHFATNGFDPCFVPVLEHRFLAENLAIVRQLFASGAFNVADTSSSSSTISPSTAPSNLFAKRYGGMIFTSQRAVEAFAQMIEDHGLPPFTTPSLPLYTVGPATARALTTLRDKHLPGATIHGEDAGNGQNLAHFILNHYNAIYPAADPDTHHTTNNINNHTQSENDTNNATNSPLHPHPKPSLLFLVGEQRRDIIPKTLMDADRPVPERIDVEELVVYETGEMQSFETDFTEAVRRCRDGKMISSYSSSANDNSPLTVDSRPPFWVVVFSPTGCEAMLRVLKMGPFAEEHEDGGDGNATGPSDVLVATIGPTTRDFLKERFGFEAHVCAERPSPEGVEEGIRSFFGGEGVSGWMRC
ncbi:hypothetical protein POX_a01775 [Penicillium oxalicum]|uniref:hypothetical protein n=1 Tax=Penicillium oxalicum TaxID=69781 RepID=UPI0020B6B28C|nr:hypothetical protein POX_a01775 [Penicillium oxalicum]KAI2795170.1 hypothetical protein POX_a01775 [Penicillium oxalicum]